MSDTRPVPGFPDYEIAQDGTLWSFHRRGFEGGPRKPHAVTCILGEHGRWLVRLSKDGKRYMRSLANLVLLAWGGEPPALAVRGGLEVEFIDGNPTNCNLTNLRWKLSHG